MRVVLYAEGPGELVGDPAFGAQPPTPGERIDEDLLGAAHVLIRRSIVSQREGVPEQAIQYVGPLRPEGHVLRGSDLLKKERLRQALNWPPNQRRPDLAVVLIDADGRLPCRRS